MDYKPIWFNVRYNYNYNYIETGELVLELIIAALALDCVEMFHGSLFKIEDGFGDFVEVRVTVYYFLR